jgi:TonB family protein
MATSVTVRARPRPLSGPAVRRDPLPVRGVVVSTIGHAIVVGGIVAAALLWRPEPTTTYIVNLTPSVPALGSTAGKAATPTRPTPAPRVEPPAPPSKSAPSELPTREPAARPTRAAVPELPARDVAPRPARSAAPPELPTRSAARIPERPTRELPRESSRPLAKELPSLAQATPPSSIASRAGATVRETAPPPPPLGRPTGVAQGAGTAASVEGDFPFQWYLTAVQRKVFEQWSQPLSALPGQKAVIVFEIARTGEVTRARIEKTSGDAAYDLAALRAVTAAHPLPPLPAEFKGPVIRVHFGFEYTGRG